MSGTPDPNAVPGVPADVYYGDVETTLPDWRKLADEGESEEAVHEELAAVTGVLGFRPADLWGESVDPETVEPK